MSDELSRIAQLLALARAQGALTSAEQLALLTSSCDRLLAVCRDERASAEIAAVQAQIAGYTAARFRAALTTIADAELNEFDSYDYASHVLTLAPEVRPAEQAGAALLAELDAARALAALVRGSMARLANGDTTAWRALDAALEAYEVTRKGAGS